MTEKGDIIEKELSSEFSTFIALWNEELGPEIIDFYPKFNIGDLEKLAVQIFTVYQFFWDSPDSDYQRTNLILPINRLNKKAKVMFDIIQNPEVRRGLQPFIIVFLVPDYFTEDDLNDFNEEILKIAQKFSRKEKFLLKDFYEGFLKLFKAKKSIKETETEISEFYSYTAAMEDFQAGLKLFQTKNLNQAYEILKKVLLKFEQEQNKHLIMELLYIIASIYTQQRKFETAEIYFKRLNKLADEMKNNKYYETSLFMQGFCAYKNENFTSAHKKFEKLKLRKLEFINKFQYFIIYGRILENLERFEDSINNYEEALNISAEGDSKAHKKQRSQLLYELGMVHYKLAFEILRNLGRKEEEKYNSHLKIAIDYFVNSIQLLKELEDFETLIQLYQSIGNIFEVFGQNSEALKNYENALNYAKKANIQSKEITILKRIIQKLIELNNYEDIISRITIFFNNLAEYKYIDLYTISDFHRKLGNSLIAINKKQEGISELEKALAIIEKFKSPVQEELDIVEDLVRIYSELGQKEKISIYSEYKRTILEKFKNLSISSPKTLRPMGDVKEIWIFHSVAGVEIFNYALESKIDNDLMGGFLTALRQFSLEISQRHFNDMIIGDNYYIMYQEEGYDYYILGRASANVPKDIIKSILAKIYRRFWKEYSQQIIEFQGNIKHFREFNNIIEALDLTLVS